MTKLDFYRRYGLFTVKILAAIAVLGIFLYVGVQTIDFMALNLHDRRGADWNSMVIVVDSLLLVPLASFILLHGVWKHVPKLQPHFVLVCALILCAFFVLFHMLHIQFVDARWNFCAFAVGYFVFCLLAAACWRMKSMVVRIFWGIMALLPIAAGYFMATYGLMGLLFILGDAVNKPLSARQMGENLVCEYVGWGNVAAGSGIIVELYKTWPAVPFLRREVARFRYDEYVVAEDDVPVPGCNDILAAYQQARIRGFSHLEFNLLIYLVKNYTKDKPRIEPPPPSNNKE